MIIVIIYLSAYFNTVSEYMTVSITFCINIIIYLYYCLSDTLLSNIQKNSIRFLWRIKKLSVAHYILWRISSRAPQKDFYGALLAMRHRNMKFLWRMYKCATECIFLWRGFCGAPTMRHRMPIWCAMIRLQRIYNF